MPSKKSRKMVFATRRSGIFCVAKKNILNCGRRRNKASVMIIALLLMAMMATMGISFAVISDGNAQVAEGFDDSSRSLMSAESGIAHIISILRGMPVSSSDPADILADVGVRLENNLNGKSNLAGEEIVVSSQAVLVPFIDLGGGMYYSAALSATADGIELEVKGLSGMASRSVSIDLSAQSGGSAIFDFGIASKGKITLIGNADVNGANSPSEADILSATYSSLEAVKLTGNCDIEGSISTANPSSYVTITGNSSIGGASGASAYDNVHIGVGDVEFPEVDPTVFEPYATNVVNSSTSTSGNRTFENIRITANTNPTFGGNITIKGVVYVESPNRVKFTGNLNITGVIVTEDAGENNYGSNYIQFTGNMNTAGVESLPDEPQFAQLKQMPGSAILAPGFETKFTGNFNTMNGAIAADKMTFTGNSGGLVKGPVICYGDNELKLTGNSALTIDRSSYDTRPPGFAGSYTLRPEVDTYAQH